MTLEQILYSGVMRKAVPVCLMTVMIGDAIDMQSVETVLGGFGYLSLLAIDGAVIARYYKKLHSPEDEDALHALDEPIDAYRS